MGERAARRAAKIGANPGVPFGSPFPRREGAEVKSAVGDLTSPPSLRGKGERVVRSVVPKRRVNAYTTGTVIVPAKTEKRRKAKTVGPNRRRQAVSRR